VAFDRPAGPLPGQHAIVDTGRMDRTARAPFLAATLVAATLACGGGGGGSSGPKGPEPQGSAGQATKLSGIGDSIMQGMDVTAIFQDQPSYSFAQGTNASVESLYSRYLAASTLPGGEEFVSESGSTMIGDAHDQAVEICGQSALPNRVVILLGANDVCGATDPESFPAVEGFQAALMDTLDELAGCLPSASRVHVLSIPRLDLLYQAVQDKRESRLNMSCPDFFHQYVPCAIAADSPAAVGAQVVAFNDGILAEVSAAADAYAVAKGIEFTTDWKGVTGGTSIGTATFGADDISDIDCFHPSATGQKKLACAAWESWEGTGDASACF
jgi:lysophospholipase L1-like esterase